MSFSHHPGHRRPARSPEWAPGRRVWHCSETGGRQISGIRIPGPKEALQAKAEGKKRCILFNLSGHGLIDMAAYDQYLAGDLSNYSLSDDEIKKNISELDKII